MSTQRTDLNRIKWGVGKEQCIGRWKILDGRDKQEEIKGYLEWRERKLKGDILLQMVNILRSKLCRKNLSREQKAEIFQGISIKIQLNTWKEHQSGSREIRWNLIEIVINRRPKTQKCGMARTGRGSKSNRMNEVMYKGMYYQMKKETTTCLYSPFIKLMYMVNVHNSSTF